MERGLWVPTYREGLSREWNEWLFFWADTMITHYYGEAKL